MRLVIDMQGLQSNASAHRGVGRYTESLVDALIRHADDDEIILALNGAFAGTFDAIKSRFLARLRELPRPGRIVVWQQFYDTRADAGIDPALQAVAQQTREHFLNSFEPDVIFSTNLQEGLSDTAITGVKTVASRALYCSTLHDLVPLYFDGYLDDLATRTWYWDKLSAAAASDIVITVSEASRAEILRHLPIAPERLHALENGYDSTLFHRQSPSPGTASQLESCGLTRPYILYVGGADLHKNLDRLLEAYAALPQSMRDSHSLALAGGSLMDDKRIQSRVAALGIGPGLVYTGKLTDEQLRTVYASCAAFVFPSLHEGFGLPVVEALACGAPVVASNIPAVAEIMPVPQALFDPLDVAAMADTIASCISSAEFRRSIAVDEQALRNKHSWDRAARRLLEILRRNVDSAIPAVPSDATAARREQAIVGATSICSRFSAQASELVAQSIAETFDVRRRRTLYVDVSTVVRLDHRTGIQRVVRAVSAALLAQSRQDLDVRLVYSGGGNRFVGANAYTWSTFRVVGPTADETVDFHADDILLFLDLNPAAAIAHRRHVRYLRNKGVSVHHVVYDILPIERPESFWPELCAEFRLWAEVVASSDGAICISKTVADKFAAFAASYGERRGLPFRVGHFHLGADIGNSAPTRGIPEDGEATLDQLGARPTFLMVGTVEPRKAHRQTLAAFDLVWSQGVEANLVIVGKMGWGMQTFGDDLLAHAETGRRLFWLNGISDEYLERIYGAANALIAASEGEGFGLPLIEAAQHGIPILARDIPVFREVAGAHADYFADSRAPSVIADAVTRWLDLLARDLAPSSANLPYLNWVQSAAQLMDVVCGDAPVQSVHCTGNLCPGTAYGTQDPKIVWSGFSVAADGMRRMRSAQAQLAFDWSESGTDAMLVLATGAEHHGSLRFFVNGVETPSAALDERGERIGLPASNLVRGSNLLRLVSKPDSDGPPLLSLQSVSAHALQACPVGAWISYSSGACIWQGFGGAEDRFRWSRERLASITFLVEEARAAGTLRLRIGTYGMQRIRLSLDGEALFDRQIDASNETLATATPPMARGIHRLVFDLPDARMPPQGDDRHLALALMGLQFDGVEEQFAASSASTAGGSETVDRPIASPALSAAPSRTVDAAVDVDAPPR